jgi:hypothetical protein
MGLPMNTTTSVRQVIAQIRHACDGTPLNRPVRALAPVRRMAARTLSPALSEMRRLHRDVEFQLAACKLFGVVAVLFAAGVAVATLLDASGSRPALQHGFAVIERFVGGLFS